MLLHPRLTSLDGTQTAWLAQIGTYGSWSDLNVTTRWGQGACGMFEASWTMPLPPGFSHPLLRRGTIVELMHGARRVGSSLVLAEPGVGAGFDQPWTLTATGLGRLVEGDSTYYALDGSGNATSVLSTAIDQGIVRGLPWAGREVGAFTVAFGANPPESVYTIGGLASAIGDYTTQRWGVGNDNVFRFMADPSTPLYHVTPGSAALGSADDDYASVVLFRYLNSTTHTWATVSSPASVSATETRYGHREFLQVAPDGLGEISAATAQAIADGIFSKSKGRLAWANGLTLTSNELLTSGGVPASLPKVAEDVGTGCMIRLHGIWDDLLETTGATYLDVILGEAKYVDGASTIDLNPLGLAPRDLAAVVESVTGMAAA